jgi:hypothetical protein
MENESEYQELISSERYIDTLEESLENLQHLHITIKEHGLSPSLIAFANMNNILSDNVEGFPSLEAYIENSELYTSEAALEGIVSKISETLSRWYNAVKAHIEKYKKFYITAAALVAAALVVIAGYKIEAKNQKRRMDESRERTRLQREAEDRVHSHERDKQKQHYKEEKEEAEEDLAELKSKIVENTNMINRQLREYESGIKQIPSHYTNPLELLESVDAIIDEIKNVINTRRDEIVTMSSELDKLFVKNWSDQKSANADPDYHRKMELINRLHVSREQVRNDWQLLKIIKSLERFGDRLLSWDEKWWHIEEKINNAKLYL